MIVFFVSQGWLSVGNKLRATAATGMNDKSSRSHSVFTMVLTQVKVMLNQLDPDVVVLLCFTSQRYSGTFLFKTTPQ